MIEIIKKGNENLKVQWQDILAKYYPSICEILGIDNNTN